MPHKKRDNHCLWEVHDLNLSTVILHFMLHTYSVAPNASNWRYILFSLLGWNLFLEFAAFWTYIIATIVLKERILQRIRLFLWVRPPPFKHPVWLWPFPKGYKNIRKAYFPALATSPSLIITRKQTFMRTRNLRNPASPISLQLGQVFLQQSDSAPSPVSVAGHIRKKCWRKMVRQLTTLFRAHKNKTHLLTSD